MASGAPSASGLFRRHLLGGCLTVQFFCSAINFLTLVTFYLLYVLFVAPAPALLGCKSLQAGLRACTLMCPTVQTAPGPWWVLSK